MIRTTTPGPERFSRPVSRASISLREDFLRVSERLGTHDQDDNSRSRAVLSPRFSGLYIPAGKTFYAFRAPWNHDQDDNSRSRAVLSPRFSGLYIPAGKTFYAFQSALESLLPVLLGNNWVTERQ